MILELVVTARHSTTEEKNMVNSPALGGVGAGSGRSGMAGMFAETNATDMWQSTADEEAKNLAAQAKPDFPRGMLIREDGTLVTAPFTKIMILRLASFADQFMGVGRFCPYRVIPLRQTLHQRVIMISHGLADRIGDLGRATGGHINSFARAWRMEQIAVAENVDGNALDMPDVSQLFKMLLQAAQQALFDTTAIHALRTLIMEAGNACLFTENNAPHRLDLKGHEIVQRIGKYRNVIGRVQNAAQWVFNEAGRDLMKGGGIKPNAMLTTYDVAGYVNGKDPYKQNAMQVGVDAVRQANIDSYFVLNIPGYANVVTIFWESLSKYEIKPLRVRANIWMFHPMFKQDGTHIEEMELFDFPNGNWGPVTRRQALKHYDSNQALWDNEYVENTHKLAGGSNIAGKKRGRISGREEYDQFLNGQKKTFNEAFMNRFGAENEDAQTSFDNIKQAVFNYAKNNNGVVLTFSTAHRTSEIGKDDIDVFDAQYTSIIDTCRNAFFHPNNLTKLADSPATLSRDLVWLLWFYPNALPTFGATFTSVSPFSDGSYSFNGQPTIEKSAKYILGDLFADDTTRSGVFKELDDNSEKDTVVTTKLDSVNNLKAIISKVLPDEFRSKLKLREVQTNVGTFVQKLTTYYNKQQQVGESYTGFVDPEKVSDMSNVGGYPNPFKPDNNGTNKVTYSAAEYNGIARMITKKLKGKSVTGKDIFDDETRDVGIFNFFVPELVTDDVLRGKYDKMRGMFTPLSLTMLAFFLTPISGNTDEYMTDDDQADENQDDYEDPDTSAPFNDDRYVMLLRMVTMGASSVLVAQAFNAENFEVVVTQPKFTELKLAEDTMHANASGRQDITTVVYKPWTLCMIPDALHDEYIAFGGLYFKDASAGFVDDPEATNTGLMVLAIPAKNFYRNVDRIPTYFQNGKTWEMLEKDPLVCGHNLDITDLPRLPAFLCVSRNRDNEDYMTALKRVYKVDEMADRMDTDNIKVREQMSPFIAAGPWREIVNGVSHLKPGTLCYNGKDLERQFASGIEY